MLWWIRRLKLNCWKCWKKYSWSKLRKNGKRNKANSRSFSKSTTRIRISCKNGGDVTGVPTGFYDLDKRTTGFHGNELIIIAGRPGMGKSALAINMATNMAVNYKNQ